MKCANDVLLIVYIRDSIQEKKGVHLCNGVISVGGLQGPLKGLEVTRKAFKPGVNLVIVGFMNFPVAVKLEEAQVFGYEVRIDG